LLISSACTRTESDATRERRESRAATPDTHEGPAYVRFVDEFTGNSHLYFGDTMLFSGTDKVTDYKQVPAERKTFSLRASASTEGDALATNSEGLDEGKYYTVVAFNDENGKASLRVVNDNESAPAEGKAKVRIIHASPEMEALKLYATGRKDEIADQSRFSTGSTWQEVDPVKGALEMRSSDKETGSVKIPNVHLEPGKLYTFVVGGGDDTSKRFHVTPIIDNPRS
jgi:hypothetical protein